MKRERLWLLLPFVAAVGACADTVGPLPPIDVPQDRAADVAADQGTDAQDDAATRDADTDASSDKPAVDVIVDDTPLPDDVPTTVDAGDDVLVEDIPPLMDVPTTTDTPTTTDAPATDTPATDTPTTTDVPTDSAPLTCTNGITDTCPTTGSGPCTDLNDGIAHTIVFTGYRAGLPASCEGTQTSMGPDGVIPLTLTSASDVVITTMPTGGDASVITLYRPGGCGNAMQELRCANTSGGSNTIRASSLAAGTYWVQVSSARGAATIVQAMITMPRPRSPGDTCPGVAVRPDGGPTTLSTMGFAADADYGTSCGGGNTNNGDAVFTFTTTAARDVTVEVSGTGTAGLSLELATTCGNRMSAVPTCTTGNPSRRTFRNLAAGTYYVTVTYGAATMTGRSLVANVTTAAPTLPAPADACPGVALMPDVATTVNVANLTPGTAALACVPRVTGDGAFTFVGPAAGSDVLVNVVSSAGNAGVQLQTPCGGMAVGACVGAGRSVWTRYTGLRAGTTYAVIAGTDATTGTLSASYRTVPTAAPMAVTNNVSCMSARTIAAAGGVYTGSTSASMTRTGGFGTMTLRPTCAATQCLGARTVFYRLDLTERRRVIATMTGTTMGFDTLLFIQSGTTCPGAALMNACNDDTIGTNAQIDTTLDRGTYWVMASGCGFNAAGNYSLDVAVVAP